MNKYKIEVKETLRKDIIVSAENEKEALNYVKDVLLKSNILDLETKDLDAIEMAVLEKNGEKLEQNITDLDEEDCDSLYKTDEEVKLSKYEYKLEKLKKARQNIEGILEKIEDNTNEIYDILSEHFNVDID